MKRDYANNQRGEVIIGVMMIIMCAVMLFGGMHMMHGGHRHSVDGNRSVEETHDCQKVERHHPLNDNGNTVPPAMKKQNLNNKDSNPGKM